MTPEEAYETALEVVSEHLVWGETASEDDARAFCIGEAAAYLADLTMLPLTRQAALCGIVEGVKAAGFPDLFRDEKHLADAVAEELNTAL